MFPSEKNKFAVRLATLLVGAVIVGANCLVCFTRAAAVFAMTAPMSSCLGDRETDGLAEASVSLAGQNDAAVSRLVRADAPAMSGHDFVCRPAWQTEISEIRTERFDLNVPIAMMSPPVVRDNFQLQRLRHFSTAPPSHSPLLIGTVIKRE